MKKIIQFLTGLHVPSQKKWGQNGDKFGINLWRITMSQKWKTLEEDIRVRYHATRKHGIRPDAYFTLRIQINAASVRKKALAGPAKV